MPGWYVWMLPFLAYYLIRKPTFPLFGFGVFQTCFLAYFLIWPESDLWDAWRLVSPQLASLATPYEWLQSNGLNASLAVDVAFTAMQVSLLMLLFWMYHAGVRSNELYLPRRTPMLLGIAGDSASGKDVLSELLGSLLGRERVIHVSGDDYHRWPRGHEQWQIFTHLNVESNELHEQLSNAIALCHGRPIQKVQYDHTRGEFTSPVPIEPNEYVIFAGLHTLYLEGMRSLFDLKIFLDPDEALRTTWKIHRDRTERGHSETHVRQQLESRQQDASTYVQPQQEFADVIVRLSAEADHESAGRASLLRTHFRIRNSVDLRALLGGLRAVGTLDVDFDYSDDLRYQRLTVAGTVTAGAIQAIAADGIPNIEELVGGQPRWFDNHNGVIQAVVLACVSSTLAWRESARPSVESVGDDY